MSDYAVVNPVTGQTLATYPTTTDAELETAIASALTPRIRHHRVDVGNLPEAVAAQLQRGGHVAESPLTDVESGSPVVVEARVPVRAPPSRQTTSDMRCLAWFPDRRRQPDRSPDLRGS